MDYSQPGSSVHGIVLARILEWVAMSSSRRSSHTQRSNPCLLHLLHCRQILYLLSHGGISWFWMVPVYCAYLPTFKPGSSLLFFCRVITRNCPRGHKCRLGEKSHWRRNVDHLVYLIRGIWSISLCKLLILVPSGTIWTLLVLQFFFLIYCILFKCLYVLLSRYPWNDLPVLLYFLN